MRATGLLACWLMVSCCYAEPIDITIFDGTVSTDSTWHDGSMDPRGIFEDEEVEPETFGRQDWDMEAFFLDGKKLGMIGGFTLSTGYDGYETGDIFVATKGTPKYGESNRGTGDNANVPNSFGYDYAIDLDFDSNTYRAYRIDSDSIVSLVARPEMDFSNPVSYVSGGQLVAEGPFLYEEELADAEVEFGLTGADSHYPHYRVSGIDLSFLTPPGPDAALPEFYLHFTQGCGNDVLMGYVPEPAQASLLLVALCCLMMAARSHRKKR